MELLVSNMSESSTGITPEWLRNAWAGDPTQLLKSRAEHAEARLDKLNFEYVTAIGECADISAHTAERLRNYENFIALLSPEKLEVMAADLDGIGTQEAENISAWFRDLIVALKNLRQ